MRRPAQGHQAWGAFWGFFGGTLVLLLLVLFSRTAGIHVDENNYLHWAAQARLGDSRVSGKPPLFYLLNYAGFHTLGAVLGPFRAFSPYVIYVVLCSASLAWFAHRVSLSPRRRMSLWALLVVSPLFVFNSTQVMMETPLLAILTILCGLALQSEDSRGARLAEAGCVIAAILLKESAIPAVAAIAAASLFYNRRLAGRLALWIAVSVVLAWQVRALLRIPSQEYGGIDRWSAWLERAPLLPTYLGLWIFLVGPMVIAAAIIGWVQFAGDASRRTVPLARREEHRDGFPLICGLCSLAFTLGVCVTSNQTFARYAYPTIWIGSLALGTWVMRWSRPALLPILVLSALLPTLNMWVPRNRTFSHWPAFITHEAIHSGLTVMFGVPVHGWALRTAARTEALCVLVPDSVQQKHVWAVRQYFSWAIPGARVFDETAIAAFDACEGRKAIVERTYRVEPGACACPGSPSFRVKVCAIQPMASSLDRAGDALNVYCLP